MLKSLPLLIVLVLTACASAPPKFYLLEAPSALSESQAPSGVYETIGIGRVSLPAYASSEKIARVDEGRRLYKDDDHRWAEPPADGLTRVLAAALSSRTGATVITEPFPRGLDPDLRVSVQFDRFLRSPSGAAMIAGQYTIEDSRGRRVLAIEPFSFEVASASAGYSAYADAVARAVGRLGAEISQRATALKPETGA
ncbi:MAG: PqiC family protein [Pseudomonadota bacterium]